MYHQLNLFPEDDKKDAPERAPESVTWNLWHGCHRVSPGCAHCYVYRRDSKYGKDASIVYKTQAFRLPVSRYRGGAYKGEYRIPSGSVIYTCFSSDFFIPEADEWRPEAWEIMRTRSDCTFFMITKRPERIAAALPPDWGTGYINVHISCTCENQSMADKRLPVFLPLPLPHKSVTHEPMLGPVDIRKYFRKYPGAVEAVSCGGESGPEARICDYAWILSSHLQCVEYGIPFSWHQTGARLRKGSHIYEIPRENQHEQARKAGLDYGGSFTQYSYED